MALWVSYLSIKGLSTINSLSTVLESAYQHVMPIMYHMSKLFVNDYKDCSLIMFYKNWCRQFSKLTIDINVSVSDDWW